MLSKSCNISNVYQQPLVTDIYKYVAMSANSFIGTYKSVMLCNMTCHKKCGFPTHNAMFSDKKLYHSAVFECFLHLNRV